LRRPGLLFDLDGTLVDTAPDLVAVLNRMLAAAGRPPVPYALARNEVSNGALGLLRLGFSLSPDTPIDMPLRQSFLQAYLDHGHNNSFLFIALDLINQIVSETGGEWGIVTNKPAAMTEALLEHLGMRQHVGALVCGDTLSERKPHPAPLLLAASQLGVDPGDCIYLGDARRDIEAGRAAGMRTVATSYGYIRPGEDISSWNADAQVDHPRKIRAMLLELTGTR